MIKNPPANAAEVRTTGSIPGRGDPLEEGMATHSCLENPMGSGAWARVHRVTKSPARLKRPSAHTPGKPRISSQASGGPGCSTEH